MYTIARNIPRASRLRALPKIYATQPQRLAHQSYGNEQSGHQQAGDESNPKRDLEHPGPEAPASKDSSNSSRPAISQPASAAEEHDDDVRKHNEEMRNRAEKTANQLSEKDNKVDRQFWKGDVGNIKDSDQKK